MDIKGKIDEIVEKLKKDPDLLNKFQHDPVKTLEGLTGIDLPDEQIKPVIAGIKAKIGTSGVADALGKITKLF